MTPAVEPTGARASRPLSEVAGRRPALPSRVIWLLLAVFALEFFLFDQFGARRHTTVYPRWNDQIQYLTESYTAYEYARAHGFLGGLWQALTNGSAQGTLHDFFALIAFEIAGPSRSAALSLNLLALIAWQAALFLAVARVSPAWPLTFAAALLPLALGGPWQNIPGSAFDFRLDHLAMCALGVTAAAAWASDGFTSRRGALFFGAAVGLTLTTRFLTGTYFVFIFAGLAGWLLTFPDRRRRRLVHLGGAALLAFAIAAPFFWINREMVRDYYWIGHYVGPESAIRNSHMGIGRSLAFIGTTLFERHLGTFFVGVAIVGFAVLACSRRGAGRPTDRAGVVIGAVFLASPVLVLTLHQQKSEVVLSALVPGLIVLVAGLWLAAARRATPAAMRIFAGVFSAAVLLWYGSRQLKPAYLPAEIAELRRVNALADDIFRRARAGRINELLVGVDHITDCLDAQVLRVIGYERHKVWLPINMTLPTGIAEPAEALVMTRLAASDFVFVTRDGPAGGYPYDQKLAAMRPQVRAWCDEHLRVASEFTLFGRSMTLYQRREIPFP